MTSIEAIGQSEIISQNVSDIDREVRKLYEVWKATQDLDTRIEVYFNRNLVSRAGPLAPFGPLSYSTSKNFPMPNGDELKVHVDLDLSKQILFDFLTEHAPRVVEI